MTKVIIYLRDNALKLWSKSQDILIIIGAITLPWFIFISKVQAQVKIPGTDQSAKLETAGTLLMIVDTALFVWLARILAGICILSAGVLIKDQKFGPAVICVVGALIIGTSPAWVLNIFEISGGGGVFR